MKILRLLSKIFFLSILFTFCVFKNVSSNEPVDIWSGNNAQEIDSQLEIKKKQLKKIAHQFMIIWIKQLLQK